MLSMDKSTFHNGALKEGICTVCLQKNGKDSSKVSEDLKVLLSQLFNSRGLEQSALDKESNASAIFSDQAMAMITRLQKEKAVLYMEALQQLRVMEKQFEYDKHCKRQTTLLSRMRRKYKISGG
ncbi:hypothetical protein DVH24_029887 [Malus domestica]|uniref:GTD-binding domain-containing protein n=1 Tax=Malus domestica TaxID=3750 RepID=A0A498HUN1_MALDO|nr:hypothetical protein DVH24_029887 [Malus domestica]